MNITLLGAAGFIGTNLTIGLVKESAGQITLVDKKLAYFDRLPQMYLKNIRITEAELGPETDFDRLLEGQDIVYHLVSSTVPTTSNQYISQELTANVVMTSKMLDACVRQKVQKVVFLSSGGTVYGNSGKCPLTEDMPTAPISSYGVQKLTIEKLLYLYQYIYGIEYKVIRLANPYGPFQIPNGVQGAVTTFTYKALKKEEIEVFGDGTVIRDYIYIDDAVHAALNIVNKESAHNVFNVGCGYGTSIIQVISTIEEVLDRKLNVIYREGRKVDVPVNYLDITRYEECFGKLNPISLREGIQKTVEFMRANYSI